MTKPKKIPRKKGAGRKPLPEHLKKRVENICLRNEQWDEIFKETTKEQLSESFYQWFKEVKALSNQLEETIQNS